MEPQSIFKSGILVLILTVIAVVSYEIYLRQKGYKISFDDSESLFANSRRKVYLPQEKATIFIGSSRIKFDIDIETWRKITGETPVQLAFVGSRANTVLKDLAADSDFKGKVLIDATEGFMFEFSGRSDRRPASAIKYYHNETPSQRFSFHVNTFLESIFVFLDKDNFSLSPFLEDIPLPPRPGHRSFPKYPVEFGITNFERQTHMTENFTLDSSQYSIMRNVWLNVAKLRSKEPLPDSSAVDSLLLDLKKDIDIIKSRGGQVVFIRPPSSGPLWKGEQMGFPKPQFWDKLLYVTQCKGIHFMDYPEINSFVCPEFSHLRPSDAILYTRNLIMILETEFAWTFNNSTPN